MIMNFEDALVELKKEPLMSFATTVDGQPDVRFMALVSYEEKYYCVTYKSRPKTQQLMTNPKFAFVVLLEGKGTTGSIRCKGTTEIIDDMDLKKQISEVIPWYSHYWDSYDDPEFILVRLHIKNLILFDPGTKERNNYEDLDL